MLEPYACLLGTTVTGLWQLAAVSDDGTIPLPGELVPEIEGGFVSLSCTQGGLSCRGPSPRHDVRWDTEPWLAMGRSEDAEEWLELVPAENQPALPLSVTAMTGWFAVGSYTFPLALILSGDGAPVVLMTTPRFALVCTDRATARAHAEQVTEVMGFRLVERELLL